MNRLSKTIGFIGILYVIPLLFAPHLMINAKILVLAISCAAMLLTQPEFNKDDSKANRHTDKNSVSIILFAGMLGQIIPVIEWGYWINLDSHSAMTIIGLVLIVSGLGIRIWAIRTLGRFFTATVQIVSGHQVVTDGPFRLVRHPSYLGAFLAIIGGAVFLNAPIGTIIAIAAMSFAYWKRITAEEKTLVQFFGEEYMQYQQSTKMIIPFVW